MAQYIVTYKCGHTAVEQLYGKHAERENYLAYAERSKLCPECYKAAQATLQAEEAARYAVDNADYGALTGTEKQVSWALTIRGKLITDMQQLPIKDAEGLRKVQGAIARQRDAHWWIDHRHDVENAIVGIRTLVAQDAELRTYLEQQHAAR